MLHDIAGDKTHPLAVAVSGLMTLLAIGDIPLAVAFILTAGTLSPFNSGSRGE